MLASKTSANTRALYLFLFAALTIVICCIGLQFILNNVAFSILLNLCNQFYVIQGERIKEIPYKY